MRLHFRPHRMDPVTDVLGRGRDPPMGRVTFGGHTLAHTDVLPVDILNVICKRAAGPTVAVCYFFLKGITAMMPTLWGLGSHGLLLCCCLVDRSL